MPQPFIRLRNDRKVCHSERRARKNPQFPLKEKTDCHSRLYGFAMTKRYVILSAERERIRNTLKRKKRIAVRPAAIVITKRFSVY